VRARANHVVVPGHDLLKRVFGLPFDEIVGNLSANYLGFFVILY